MNAACSLVPALLSSDMDILEQSLLFAGDNVPIDYEGRIYNVGWKGCLLRDGHVGGHHAREASHS